jgi:zinc D-Ala-D-Ala dipeptidase
MNMRFLLIIGFIFALFSCNHPNTIKEIEVTIEENDGSVDDSIHSNQVKNTSSNCVDSTMESLGFIDIQKVNSSIHVELKYATNDNFMKQKLYQTLTKLYLQKEVAERISNCQNYLKTIHPSYSLLIHDGVRPIDVQQRMWDALDSIPPSERGKFVSNPKNHSVHNYGAAVDLTIIDETGTPLDMGAEVDDIRKIAYPGLESQFLASGELTIEQVNNRKLLRKVMQNQGFINIPSEWWHFNAYRRDVVKTKYKVLLEEPCK